MPIAMSMGTTIIRNSPAGMVGGARGKSILFPLPVIREKRAEWATAPERVRVRVLGRAAQKTLSPALFRPTRRERKGLDHHRGGDRVAQRDRRDAGDLDRLNR